MSSLGTVTLFNSNIAAIGLLRRLLESAGFAVATASIPDAGQERADLDSFIETHDPSVVVYDIGPPYAHNWRRFEWLRAQPSMRNRRFVITAADAVQVERLAGNDGYIFEVIDRGSDPGAIVQVVKEAARARTTRVINPAAATRSNLLQMPDRRQHDRRESSWTSNDLYQRLREKQAQVERRRGGRRATDVDDDPHHHAA